MAVDIDEGDERCRFVGSAGTRQGDHTLYQGDSDTRYVLSANMTAEVDTLIWTFSSGKHIAGVIGAINDAVLHAIPPVRVVDIK